MTARSSRRVVIINNIKSDKIEQAIFILKGSSGQKVDRFIVREAQDIIDNYVKKVEGKPQINNNFQVPRKRRKIGGGLMTIIVTAVILSLIFLVRSIT